MFGLTRSCHTLYWYKSIWVVYWSELLVLSYQLFADEELTALQQMVADVEAMVFDEEQLEAGYSLYDIEMAIESNPDYYAYFDRSDGIQVTKFDVERRLDKVKQWIFARVRDKAQVRRFSRFR